MGGGKEGEKMQGLSHEGDEEEEEKMEKFFAAIRSIREAKDSLKDESKLKKMRTEPQKKAVSTPSFRWEDFMQEIELKSRERESLPPAGPSKKDGDHDQDNKDNKDDSLNLNLSL